MAAPPPQMVQLTCPNCRAPLRAPVVTLIDVGRQPEMKSYLLSGQLNVVACPSCGFTSMLAAPLVYHDPAKQLFLVHFPQQLNARPGEEEKFIGDATSLLMRSLPQDASKAYLLAPRRFLTLNSLIEAVLEADGVTKEMLEAQRRRVELINILAEGYEAGEEQLAALVQEHRAELDYEFFSVLTAFAESTAQAQPGEEAQLLLNLRDKLVELTGFEGDAETGVEPSIDEAIDRLVAAPGGELEQLIVELRPLIDYEFFESWTGRIDAAEQAGDTAEAARLTSRRTAIRETVERIDQQAREMFEAGARLLQQVLAAEDPADVLRRHSQQIDEAFLLVLEANRAAAERSGRADMVQRMDEIRTHAVSIAEEALSPEDRFINELLRFEEPQDATALLRTSFDRVTPELIKRMNELAAQFEQDGQKPLADRLRALAREAGVMLF